MKHVYLDNAATTPMDDRVIEAMLPFMRGHYGNPSSVHSHGREVRSAIEKARKKVAELLHPVPQRFFLPPEVPKRTILRWYVEWSRITSAMP